MKRALGFALTILLTLAASAMAEEPAVGKADDAKVAAFFDSYAAACEREGGQLWGVSLCGPFLVYDQKNKIVYANTADSGGILQQHGSFWRGVAPADNEPPYSNTSAEWSGVRWATLRIDDLDDPVSSLRLSLHESYHRVQPQLNHAYENTDLPGHLDSEQGRALLRAELRALRAGLEAAAADKKGAARRHLRDAAKFRLMRYRLFDTAAERERSLEIHEGLAEYTGWRAAEESPNFAAIAAQLEKKDSEKSYMRSFAYWTGPGYGFLFDYLKADWRGQFTNPEASFLTIAKDTVGGVKLPKRATYESLAKKFPEYGVEAIYAEEAAIAKETAARKADYVARFVEGRRLIVPVAQITFDPRTVMSLDPYGQVYGTLSTSGPWGSVSTKSGGLVSWKDQKVYLDRREVEGPSPWTTDVWTLSISDGWTLRDDGRDLIVEEDK